MKKAVKLLFLLLLSLLLITACPEGGTQEIPSDNPVPSPSPSPDDEEEEEGIFSTLFRGKWIAEDGTILECSANLLKVTDSDGAELYSYPGTSGAINVNQTDYISFHVNSFGGTATLFYYEGDLTCNLFYGSGIRENPDRTLIFKKYIDREKLTIPESYYGFYPSTFNLKGDNVSFSLYIDSDDIFLDYLEGVDMHKYYSLQAFNRRYEDFDIQLTDSKITYKYYDDLVDQNVEESYTLTENGLNYNRYLLDSDFEDFGVSYQNRYEIDDSPLDFTGYEGTYVRSADYSIQILSDDIIFIQHGISSKLSDILVYQTKVKPQENELVAYYGSYIYSRIEKTDDPYKIVEKYNAYSYDYEMVRDESVVVKLENIPSAFHGRWKNDNPDTTYQSEDEIPYFDITANSIILTVPTYNNTGTVTGKKEINYQDTLDSYVDPELIIEENKIVMKNKRNASGITLEIVSDGKLIYPTYLGDEPFTKVTETL